MPDRPTTEEEEAGDEANGASGGHRRASRRRGTKRVTYSLPFSQAGLTPTAMRLLQAARRVFERSGVRALSYEAIGREADLSPSLIRYHFGSKSELLLALAAWVVYGDVEEDAWHALAEHRDRDEVLQMLLRDARGVLTDLKSYELFYDLLPYMLHDERARAGLASLFKGAIDIRAAGLNRPRVSEDDPDSWLLTAMTLALADGLAIQLLADPQAVDFEKAMRFWRECVEEALRRGERSGATPVADDEPGDV